MSVQMRYTRRMRLIGILWVIACASVAVGGPVASSTEDVYQTDVEFVPKTAIDSVRNT